MSPKEQARSPNLQGKSLPAPESAKMAQQILEPVAQIEQFSFPDFIQNRFQDSSILNPTEFPVNDQDRQSIANIVEEIDRISVQGILVRTLLTQIHADFSKHVAVTAAVYRTAHPQTSSDITHALWVQEATGGPAVDAIDSVKGMLENIPPAVLRSLLLELNHVFANALR